MVQKRISRYASMTASELAAETRKRGLSKPDGMLNISEWVDFLEAEDAKSSNTDTKPTLVVTPSEHGTDEDALKPFEDMTVAELKAYAEEHEIDLGDATKKADIIAALEAKG